MANNTSVVPPINLDRYFEQLKEPRQLTMRGRVRQISSGGILIRARLPNARIGELCTIEPSGRAPVKAQVVGFDDEDVFLTAVDSLDNVGPHKDALKKRPERNHHSLYSFEPVPFLKRQNVWNAGTEKFEEHGRDAARVRHHGPDGVVVIRTVKCERLPCCKKLK